MNKEIKNKESCSDCKFGVASTSDFSGEDCFICHRYPPVIDVVYLFGTKEKGSFAESDPVYWANPFVHPSHWCGEHVLKKMMED